MFEEQQQIGAICERLLRDSNSLGIVVFNKGGQPLATAGNTDRLDGNFESLFAGDAAAAGGIARFLAEQGFVESGEHTSIYLTIVARRVGLFVVFDERSAVGLVRLRVRQAARELSPVIDALAAKMASGPDASMLGEITDDDINEMFNR